MHASRSPARAALALLLALLAGCEMLGIDSPEKLASLKENEGKAVGSACRHANRAIEDCYTLNPKASKAAVFAGWREMDEYMRENKLEAVAPTLPRAGSKTATPGDTTADGPVEATASNGGVRKPAPGAGGKAVHDS